MLYTYISSLGKNLALPLFVYMMPTACGVTLEALPVLPW